MNQACGRNVTQIEHRVFSRFRDGFTHTINLPTVNREIGAYFKTPGNPLFLFAGDAIYFFGT